MSEYKVISAYGGRTATQIKADADIPAQLDMAVTGVMVC